MNELTGCGRCPLQARLHAAIVELRMLQAALVVGWALAAVYWLVTR